MTLIAIRPTQKAPQMRDGGTLLLKYPWTDWVKLKTHLEGWGVDAQRLVDTNDGERIPALVARKIADAIEAHLCELERAEQQWLRPHIRIWRNGGGFRQY